MKKIRFNYSLKNIRIPSPDAYRKKLIEKVESVINRMRWKAYFFLHRDNTIRDNETSVLRSTMAASRVNELNPFDEDLVKMVENIKFRDVNDHFLSTLSNDARMINSSTYIMAFADKTRNIYEMKPDRYSQLLTENVTKSYKLGNEQQFADINRELKEIASKLHIDDRIEPMARKPAFISLKDHKKNFENHPKCRLINPVKSELGKVSKAILDRINTDTRARTEVNQWRNSSAVTEWFNGINNKPSHTFISFNIVDFYPSISEDLLNQAISWAKHHTNITEEEAIIKHARKSLLFHGEKPWIRRERQNMFDVTMGSNDGAEVCELIGLYVLESLSQKFDKKNIGLYLDDGLILLKNGTARLAEKAKKDLTKAFQTFGLKITATANQKIVNFLDITLNLQDQIFQPYRKPNDDTLYINKRSNHPPSIIKQLPKSISQRISKLSSNHATFVKAAPIYNEALTKTGFTNNIEYLPNDHPNIAANQRRKRSGNIT